MFFTEKVGLKRQNIQAKYYTDAKPCKVVLYISEVLLIWVKTLPYSHW